MGVPNISSSAPSSSQVEPTKPAPAYRHVQPLPAQLLDHCSVCIEEQLFSQAIPLLSSAVTAGHGTPRPAFVPPAQHLSLLATLIVHPSMTTRTTSEEKQTASDDSVQYLRQLNGLTSANASGLTKALQYRDAGSSRSKRARTRFSDISSDDDLGEDPGHIRSTYAKKDSLFANAEDFWAVVGWAFNCSIVHKHRWARWSIWLDLMIDVLQDDLESTYQRYRESSPRDETILTTSLIAQYLAPFADQGRNTKRRIMRAILADGQKPSLNQYPEIWRNETLPPKSKAAASSSKPTLKRPLDLDQGEYGDYFDSESDTEATPTSDRPSRPSSALATSRTASPSTPSTPQPTNTPSSTDLYGGQTSLHLRLRLLTLLTRLATLSPKTFLDPEDLFDLYTEFLRPLPLPVFSYFILSNSHTTATSSLDAHSQASLNQMLLRPLLSPAAPVYNANALTAADFAAYFAPFAANVGSVSDNARVGVLVEGLLRLLWAEGGLGDARDVAAVKEAVEEGILAREEKAGFDGRRKSGAGGGKGVGALEALVAGGERMRCLLGVL
ncbi:hypothetical protein Q7P37_009449 [Cladosporium fusiforme]